MSNDPDQATMDERNWNRSRDIAEHEEETGITQDERHEREMEARGDRTREEYGSSDRY